jgi:DNA polymerase-3 subunit delta
VEVRVLTFAEFQKSLDSGRIPPVLVLHGEEPFLARLAVGLLKTHVLAPGSEAFDFASLIGRETTAEAIVAQATTAPMLSERRLTVVYEFERMNPSQKSRLLDYVGRPNEATCLALVSYQRLAGSSKFERTVLASAAVVDCARPAGELLVSLVKRMAEERGTAIDEEALSVLIDWTDGSLNRIANELDKLACFASERRAIALSDVEQVVGARAAGLRDLATAIAKREAGEALALLAELVDGGLDEAQLVSQLYGFWIALWRARLGAQGGSRGRGGGFRRSLAGIEDLRELAASRTSREYARGVARFYRADTAIRRGTPAGPVVGLLVYELAGGA